MISLIHVMPHFEPLTCPLCRERFKIGNGPWPAVPSKTRKNGFKPVCLECASVEEPDRDYGGDGHVGRA
jgi:hypothetical protein